MYDEVSDTNQITFKLLSGSTPTYTNWGTLEPNPLEKCVAFQVKDTTQGEPDLGKWSVVSCTNRNGYFCKKPIQPVPTTTPVVSYLGCPVVRIFERFMLIIL